MPMAKVSFTFNGRSATVVCHSYEDADELACSLVFVHTGLMKEPGTYLVQPWLNKSFTHSDGFSMRIVAAKTAPDLSKEELSWLRVFANHHGRQWKSKLRTLWFNNKDVGIARALRNNTAFAQGLTKFKLPEE